MVKIVKVPNWIVRLGILPSDISVAIAPYIFLNNSLYQDYITGKPNWFTQSMIEHEIAHIERQEQLGVIVWLWRYMTSNSFCFQEEIIALKREMDVYRQNNEEFSTDKKARLLSKFWIYHHCVSYFDAKCVLDALWTKMNDNLPPT